MSNTHNGSLDYAKLMAAFGIVWFHTGAPGASYGYAGLAFFLIGLVLMAPSGIQRHSFADYARHRAARLLVPWLLWSAIYGGLKLAEVATTSATLDTEFDVTMLLTGPAIHLWFLPFAYVVGLALYPLIRRTGTDNNVFLAILFGLLTLVAMAAQTPLPDPLAQWAYAVPSLTFGLCVIFSGTLMRQLAAIAVISLIGLSAGWSVAPQLILAALVLAACTAVPVPGTTLSAKAARLSLTVYLLHPLVVALLLRGTEMPSNSVTFAVLAVTLTTVTALVIDLLTHRTRPVPQPQLSRA